MILFALLKPNCKKRLRNFDTHNSFGSVLIVKWEKICANGSRCVSLNSGVINFDHYLTLKVHCALVQLGYSKYLRKRKYATLGIY